jgi:hypothetical protein
MIAYAGAAYLRMTILFPEDRPFTSHSLDVAPLGSREAPVSFRGQSMFLRDPSRTAIKWEIPNPIPNQVYRFSWQW